MKRRGFTIVDVLVTIILMGIMASIIIPKIYGVQARARLSAQIELLAIYNHASLRCQTDTDMFVNDLKELTSETSPDTGLAPDGSVVARRKPLWRGPYVSGVQNDPVSDLGFKYVTKGRRIGTVLPPDGVEESGEVTVKET
jgi:type II secretory pathway pseudopilin PulG